MSTPQGTSLVRGPYVTDSTGTKASIRWFTKRYTECTLVLGGIDRGKTLGHDHRVTVVGLTPATSYPYTIAIMGAVRFSGTLRTPPASGLIKFCVMGDSGVGQPEQMAMAKRIEALDPDFVIHTGDVIYPSGYKAETRYDPYYFCVYGPSISKIPWYHVSSAHDVEPMVASATGLGRLHYYYFTKPGNPILTTTGLPAQTNYSVRIANIEFFFIDVPNGYGDYLGLDLPWLDATMAASTAQWKIAVCSTPIYSTGTIHVSDTVLRGLLEPIYQARALDISFAGHQHSYQRTTAVFNGVAGSGPMHVMTGGGGQALYSNGAPQSWTAAQFSDFHTTYCEINGNALQGQPINRDGTILETFNLTT